ncbi:ATP-dependent helicase HrpB [Agrobacterium sp. ES01]|uniref:ATP-dependent helicase HrpB n=1 Tax=Agrobacterium sp. ES01 TaxID=3420714 RepID=UPI003D0D09B0
MPFQLPDLPVTAVLPDLGSALAAANRAILSAPPGAGKTTLVPLYLLQQDWLANGKIIVLEPRRLAARAAAARMAFLFGEAVGETIGYRMRLDSRISTRTRIEVVTEGVFARMILDDPELSGVSAVLFDEFHERSLDADFGLALALDVQSALRPDLRLVVMSATLDVARIAELLVGAPVIESHGRSYPVDIRYRDRPGSMRIEDAMTDAILDMHATEDGSILAFLPGQAEIRRVAERLEGRLPVATHVTPLYGNLDQSEQDAAIRPAARGTRKIVLATSIAETSITIDGVRIVIDSGQQRLPVFEPATGITRLETVKASRASADQRAGRAGRTEPGIALRLWHAGQTAGLPPFSPPEILASDLSGLVLDMAHWGVSDPSSLALIDQPPAAAFKEARALLQSLGAVDLHGRLTERGKMMRGLGLSPRLAAMVVTSAERGLAREASLLAVLLGEQGLGGNDIDLDERLRRFRQDNSPRAKSARTLAARLAADLEHLAMKQPSSAETLSAGIYLMHAFPDRIAFARAAKGRFVLSNGRGAQVQDTDRLANARMLVVADMTGRAVQARILAAAEISRADVEDEMPNLLLRQEEGFFDPESRKVRARRVVRIGAIILEETPLPAPSGETLAQALADGVRLLGLSALPLGKSTRQLRQRVSFLHQSIGEPWPDMSDRALMDRLDEWFIPFQGTARDLSSISASSLHDGLMSLVPHNLQRDLAKLVPTHFIAPTGQSHPIAYDGDEPVVSIRVQELYGLRQHPAIRGGNLPLLIELTSPAHRPIQKTRDLPGFWAGSWKDVRADMRGRYPKHEWPENPAEAQPTTRAKPRGT